MIAIACAFRSRVLLLAPGSSVWLEDGPGRHETISSKRVRKKGKYVGRACGGGGTQRALVSAWLRANKPQMRNREERKLQLQNANAWAREARLSGGVDFQAAVQRGKAASVSYRAGGSSFGRLQKKPKESCHSAILDVHHAHGNLPRAPLDAGVMVRTDVAGDGRAARAEEAKSAKQQDRALAEWSMRQVPSLNAVHTAMQRFAGQQTPPIRRPPLGRVAMVHAVPPLQEFALSAASGAGHGLHNLEHNWNAKHIPIVHERLPAPLKLGEGLRPGLWNQSVCARVGFCMCSRANRESCKGVVESVLSCLKRWCKKGSNGRKLLQDGRAVIHVSGMTVDHYLHLGFVNFKSWDTTVLPLVVCVHEMPLPEGTLLLRRRVEKRKISSITSSTFVQNSYCKMFELMLES